MMLEIILGRLGLPASVFINEREMHQAYTKRTQRQGARYSSWRGGKVVLESDRVWPRRTARHSVAFSCSPDDWSWGGGGAEGAQQNTCPHHPTRGVQGPLWHQIDPLPCTIALHQDRCSCASPKMQWVDGVWVHRGARQGPTPAIYASSVLGQRAPCTSPRLHFDHHCRRNSLNPILFKEILNYAQNM